MALLATLPSYPMGMLQAIKEPITRPFSFLVTSSYKATCVLRFGTPTAFSIKTKRCLALQSIPAACRKKVSAWLAWRLMEHTRRSISRFTRMRLLSNCPTRLCDMTLDMIASQHVTSRHGGFVATSRQEYLSREIGPEKYCTQHVIAIHTTDLSSQKLLEVNSLYEISLENFVSSDDLPTPVIIIWHFLHHLRQCAVELFELFLHAFDQVVLLTQLHVQIRKHVFLAGQNEFLLRQS
eukprot:m.22442 g.22442  ORF g.22442 m.22442 type:complete len:237 (+) comp11253_c0_seq1:1790-2500(+)